MAENNAVLIMLCSTFALYLLLAIWARYKDKKDVERWSVYPLKDNMVHISPQ